MDWVGAFSSLAIDTKDVTQFTFVSLAQYDSFKFCTKSQDGGKILQSVSVTKYGK